MTLTSEVQPDSRLLFPYICEITAPDGQVIALHNRTTGPVNIRVELLTSAELQSISEELGTVLKDPTLCSTDQAVTYAAERLILNSQQELSIEYAKTRSLRDLPRGSTIPRLRENLTDRYQDKDRRELILLSQPSFPIKVDSKSLGQSFCWLERLELLFIREVTP